MAHRPDQVIGRENLILTGLRHRAQPLPPSTLYSSLCPVWGGPCHHGQRRAVRDQPPAELAWRHGRVCVRRGKGDATVVENTVREVREGRGALVFPEGTRTKEGNLGKLKSGAFVIAAEAGVDMIPCRIIYKGGKMRVFGRCTVVFGKPIPAEKLKLGEPRSAARLRECKALLAEELEKLLEENRQYL
ncbi:MAG: lysophospholipid acyltransferase family protein [Ruthenibacterium lactatiformans]